VTFDTSSGDYVFPLVNPYPKDTTFGDLETFAVAGDMVYVFDADNWDLAGYTFNGFENNVSAGWYFLGADGSEDTITNSSAVILPAGKGAFIQVNETATWTASMAN